MEVSPFAVRATIWVSLLAWVAGEWRRSAPGASATVGRGAWTLGAAAVFVHTLLAFHVHHAWSHAAALADTARQSAEMVGVAAGGGLYANYAFVAAWIADAAWWRADAAGFQQRPRWLDRLTRAFLWFMFANGAFVFVRGPRRFAGAAAAVAVAAAWYRGRGAGERRG